VDHSNGYPENGRKPFQPMRNWAWTGQNLAEWAKNQNVPVKPPDIYTLKLNMKPNRATVFKVMA
jgi:hypothetical protein